MATIPTGDNKLPTPQPLRPANPAKRLVIEETIREYLSMDIIEKCTSPTAAAIVVVKQNGKNRF
ncbi:hypothetical protein BJ508DRAFT_209682, partial [Ascobolus immersus RN42]